MHIRDRSHPLTVLVTTLLAYTTRLGPPNARCVRQTYSLDVTSENIVFQNVRSDANQSEITNLLQQFIASFPYASNFTDTYEKGTEPLSGTYQLSGTLCVPKTGERNVSHIQFLVHGVGVDSRYWDYTADDDEYSYVSASADAGIATFRYDRLGTGLSEKPKDAYNVVQAATDTAITVKFAEMLRDGSIGIKGQEYNKIIGVGHSYGSIVMQAVTSNAPTALDGVMLTGFSANATAIPVTLTSLAFGIASVVSPHKFPASEFSNAYLVSLGPSAVQLNSWAYPYYSDAAFAEAAKLEQPVSQGLILTSSAPPRVSTDFLGPVHIVTGDKDWIFCFANCYAVPPGSTRSSIIDYAEELFPAASSFSTYIPGNTGHSLNQHYSAPDTFQNMLKFAENVFEPFPRRRS